MIKIRCKFCDSEDPDCFEGCNCAKCIDPEAYEYWKNESPEEYENWLQKQEE